MHEPIATLPVEMKAGGIETRGVVWGDVRARWLDLPPGVDFTPLLAGLPGDLCGCPHWGYVLRGSIYVRYADGNEEISSEGETYYWPGGHTGWSGADGVTFLEFSPAAEIEPVLAHIAKKMAG